MSKIIKITVIPQLIANNMSGCFFSETRCTCMFCMTVVHNDMHSHLWVFIADCVISDLFFGFNLGFCVI